MTPFFIKIIFMRDYDELCLAGITQVTYPRHGRPHQRVLTEVWMDNEEALEWIIKVASEALALRRRRPRGLVGAGG